MAAPTSTVQETPPNNDQAEKYKFEANEYFKIEKYAQAVELYTKAIELNPGNAVYFANRSIANHRLENFGEVLQVCR